MQFTANKVILITLAIAVGPRYARHLYNLTYKRERVFPFLNCHNKI